MVPNLKFEHFSDHKWNQADFLPRAIVPSLKPSGGGEESTRKIWVGQPKLKFQQPILVWLLFTQGFDCPFLPVRRMFRDAYKKEASIRMPPG